MSFPRNHFARSLRHTPRKPWKPLQQLLGACRWLVDRVPRGLTWAGLAALGWLAVAVGVMAWLLWPLQVGWFLTGAAVSAAVCLPLRSRRLAAVEAVEQRFDAYRLADARTDLDTVGPVTGQHLQAQPVELFDQDAQPAFQHGGVVPRNPGPHVFSGVEIPTAPARFPQGVQVHVTDGEGLVDNLRQLITDRTPADSTGPAWVTCGRCAGRGWFDAVPAQGLRWMQCPECSGAGGQWGQS